MAAADDPPEVTIEPHLEMSYNKEMPGKIMFYCHHAPLPGEGGQTPICDMRRVYQQLSQHSLLQPLVREGLRYYRTLPSRHTSQGSLYSWEKTFFTEDRGRVERTLGGKKQKEGRPAVEAARARNSKGRNSQQRTSKWGKWQAGRNGQKRNGQQRSSKK